MELLAPAFLVIAVAAAAQAVTGFGFVLVSVPTLTVLIDPRTAVVACTTLGLMVTSLGWYEGRSDVQWRPVLTIVVGAAVGIPLGLLVFTSLAMSTLQLLIGVVVLTFTGLLLLRIRVPAGGPTELLAGMLSGGMVGTTGMTGPPLVLALQAARLRPAQFRATLQAAMTVLAVVVVGGFVATGQFSETGAWVVAVGAPALWLGWRVGDRWFRRLHAEHVRRLILLTLVVSGTLSAVRGLMSS